MSDDSVLALAHEAGLSPIWTDNTNTERSVSLDVLRAALSALGLPAHSCSDIADSRAKLAQVSAERECPPLIAMRQGEMLDARRFAGRDRRLRLEFETGGALEMRLPDGAQTEAEGPILDRLGYHRLILGDREITLAVAPHAARTIGERRARAYGLAAQVYGLRRKGDGGIGDFGALATLCEKAAVHGADLVALSPCHALFAADAEHFTPYSPSNRRLLNVLFSDPTQALGAGRVSQATAARGLAPTFANLESLDLIDWPEAARARMTILRALYDDFRARDLASPSSGLAVDFQRFRKQGGPTLEKHATFEALHSWRFGEESAQWNWRDWPANFRNAASDAVATFARENEVDVAWHVFLQWLADRSLAQAQGRARAAGMRVGLVTDLAVGMNAGGSEAWSAPDDLLLGLSIGAPPDMLAPLGQNWGLTTFSPLALQTRGFAPYLATLRAALRNAGGIRMDHVLGLVRLWLVPDGAHASDGVYLSFPTETMIALLTLESHRHDAIVIGEDLGTVPYGLRDRLQAAGIAGMRVLQFERDHERFFPPDWYTEAAVAMPATHDTATIAGFWCGADIAARAAIGHLPPGQNLEDAAAQRARDCAMLWDGFAAAGVTNGAPCPTPSSTGSVVDAAIRVIGRTRSQLAIVPVEDALGLVPQPNLPGTTTEHPNWRRRYPADVETMLDAPDVDARMQDLAHARGVGR